MLLRNRLLFRNLTYFLPSPSSPPKSVSFILSFNKTIESKPQVAATRAAKTVLFVSPGVDPEDVTDEMIFAWFQHRTRTICGSNVGKSSLINALVRKKEVALTSKKPGKTQLINHFLVNKSWYIVDLPGYGFAKASDTARTDWSSFTKGYFLNRGSLVAVLLLIDASVPPQKIDLDCANWLGRNNIPMTFVFTKCDKMKASKGNENIRDFEELIRENYKQHPPWIMMAEMSFSYICHN
ncbi:hypothetical protein V6N13_111941 [Hibiscus sabdariffa]